MAVSTAGMNDSEHHFGGQLKFTEMVGLVYIARMGEGVKGESVLRLEQGCSKHISQISRLQVSHTIIEERCELT